MAGTISVKIVGIGGQGVLRTSQVLGEAVRRRGYDVKQSEVHGMSQRGGSVVSEVRFGDRVFSPLTPAGEADFLLGLNPQETERNRAAVKAEGVVLEPPGDVIEKLADPRGVNMVLIGMLSRHLEIPREVWQDAIRACMPKKAVDNCLAAFALGAEAG